MIQPRRSGTCGFTFFVDGNDGNGAKAIRFSRFRFPDSFGTRKNTRRFQFDGCPAGKVITSIGPGAFNAMPVVCCRAEAGLVDNRYVGPRGVPGARMRGRGRGQESSRQCLPDPLNPLGWAYSAGEGDGRLPTAFSRFSRGLSWRGTGLAVGPRGWGSYHESDVHNTQSPLARISGRRCSA